MADNRGSRPTWIRYSGIGIEFASAVAVFALIGYWVDRHWGVTPWGMVIGASLGLIGGMYNLVRESLAAFKNVNTGGKAKEDDDPAGPRP